MSKNECIITFLDLLRFVIQYIELDVNDVLSVCYSGSYERGAKPATQTYLRAREYPSSRVCTRVKDR